MRTFVQVYRGLSGRISYPAPGRPFDMVRMYARTERMITFINMQKSEEIQYGSTICDYEICKV